MPAQRLSLVIAAFLAALPSLTGASPSFDCSNIVSQKVRWNLKELGGARSVHWTWDEAPSIKNFTFTLDICRALPRHKGVAPENECPGNTRVCGIEYSINPYENTTQVDKVVPIAGDYHLKTGQPLDAEVFRLKHSGSSVDSEKEGVRVELSGGKYPLQRGGVPQKAIIEFLCDKTRDGTDTEKDDRDVEDEEGQDSLSRRAEDDDKKDKEQSLQFISYKVEKPKDEDWGILRLEWHTKYACESAIDEPSHDGSSWGFFTWFIIIVFLAIAAYLIFGSWLNYNRYGARGWDLLPHGDAIRDIPYVMKDFGRRMASTVQGGGSRGGYSAV